MESTSLMRPWSYDRKWRVCSTDPTGLHWHTQRASIQTSRTQENALKGQNALRKHRSASILVLHYPAVTSNAEIVEGVWVAPGSPLQRMTPSRNKHVVSAKKHLFWEFLSPFAFTTGASCEQFACQSAAYILNVALDCKEVSCLQYHLFPESG
jgi:hypothetical protein